MSKYNAEDIQVLEGLDPVRKRPGMYIGSTSSTGLHHLLWEILDNCVDEALNEHCDTIEVTLDKDHGVTIKDNGRGIPVDLFRKTKKSAMEILFTTLHSGGKFSQDNYKVSGGLHGVGMAVVCALSEKLIATSRRDGFEWTQTYSRGKPTAKLKKGKPVRIYGTTVYFKPDGKIFPKTEFNPKLILERAESKAFLNKGLKIIVNENRNTHTFHYPGGIQDYIKKIVGKKATLMDEPFYVEKEDKLLKLEAAFFWTPNTDTQILSFANSIRTIDGGTHENGFRNGITKAIRAYIDRRKLLPKDIPGVTGDDVREGLIAIINIYLQGEVEFQGQTKGRLNSEITSQVEAVVKHTLEHYLNENQTLGNTLADRVILSAQARIASRQAKEAVQRKTNISHRLNLPGKLADCATTDKDQAELFICEGDSAGGSSKQARDRKTQAILPIRGKILNVETATMAKTLANTEIQNLISACGTGIESKFDYNKLRYGKIIIMTDADVDGAHICTLLLTFFYRCLPEIIEKGHLFIAQPPLYRIDAGKKIFYALSDEEKDKIIKGLNGTSHEIGRFKGLGEMPASDLKETTMSKKSRSLIRVALSSAEQASRTVSQLMGKNAESRFQFIKEKAVFVQDLDV
ncbi:MAG: type IIA DNA topoisomerase subunit B [Nitrospina sp.]|jgi:DNA gyrase subunit B|nr:type IIA DNA topoisomerase subunit B [Nitrospina sp.]MBT3413522.1 type IIA DNA topoisomerase subunit B [Nitrospina sp.]MBT3855345.1 type IIA DNA topoisomerase subunit B [Nitrospina sp.]MBT4104882.1 type IIA DNA topoisomerase subunit B [Nitrospina sp.]MBT4389369.1 type IIA DNA topoisomerase subunit B [Nitrospina sp.]